MLLPIKPICSASKIRRDGTSLIFIQYCQNAEHKTLLNTEIAIPPNYWHNRHTRISEKLPEPYGKAEDLNKELQRQIRLAEDIISFAITKGMEDPVQFAKTTFNPKFNPALLEKTARNNAVAKPKVNQDFFFHYDAYITSKLNTVADSTLGVFRNLKVILEAFQAFRKKQITFDRIDYEFYDEFVQYLTFEHIHQNRKDIVKGFKTNTVGKNVKQLIIFLKTPRVKRIAPEMDLTGFKNC